MIQRLKNNRFVWNSLVLFSGTMLVNVLNYLFHLAVGRMVSSEVYGEIESLISLLAIVSVPAAALGLMATQYSAKMKNADDILGTQAVFRYLNKKIVVFGLPLLLLAFLATPFVSMFLKLPSPTPLLFLWILMFLSFLGAVTNGILSGWQRFSLVNVGSIWSALTKFVLGIFLIRIGFGVHGAVGSFLLAGLVGYGITLLYVRRIFGGATGKEVSSLDQEPAPMDTPFDSAAIKGSVLPTFMGIFAITILGNVDVIFAKHALDPAISGEYSALSIVAKTIFFVTGVIASVLFAMTSGNDDKSTAASKRTLLQAFGLTAVFGIASTLFFFLFSSFSLQVFFGDTYLHVSQYLPIFAVMAVLYSLANLLLQYLISLHRPKMMVIFLGIAVGEVIALSLFGNHLYDIILLAIGTQAIAVLVGCYFAHTTFRIPSTSSSSV